MENPFDEIDGRYLALINDDGQYSLWPEFIDIPTGWRKAFGPDNHQDCVNYVERHWQDMRPKSLLGAAIGAC